MVIYQNHSPQEAYEAFSELYARFDQKVFSFLMKKVRNQAEAEDLLQKTFLKVHESKHLYQPKYKFEQWIFVIARSAVLDFLRASSRYQKRLSGLANQPTEESAQAPELFSSLNHSLTEDQKEMLEMKYIDELSYQEMAALLNKSETSLRKTLSRLMIHLRKGEA